MGFFKKSRNIAPELSVGERDAEILLLEGEREGIDTEIERLLSEYARLTRNRSVKRGAVRRGSSPKDMSYWNFLGEEGKK